MCESITDQPKTQVFLHSVPKGRLSVCSFSSVGKRLWVCGFVVVIVVVVDWIGRLVDWWAGGLVIW